MYSFDHFFRLLISFAIFNLLASRLLGGEAEELKIIKERDRADIVYRLTDTDSERNPKVIIVTVSFRLPRLNKADEASDRLLNIVRQHGPIRSEISRPFTKPEADELFDELYAEEVSAMPEYQPAADSGMWSGGPFAPSVVLETLTNQRYGRFVRDPFFSRPGARVKALFNRLFVERYQ